MKIEQVYPGVFRSAQPEVQADFEAVLKLGQRVVVIDLENESGESPWEQAQWAQFAARINFQSFPMSSFWPPSEDKVKQILATIASAVAQGFVVLVHCKHGQDRTGLIIGELRLSKGWDKDDAWGEMLDKGFHPILLGLTIYFWLH